MRFPILTVGCNVLPSVAGDSTVVFCIGVEFVGASTVVIVGVAGDSTVVVWKGGGVRLLWEIKTTQKWKIPATRYTHLINAY